MDNALKAARRIDELARDVDGAIGRVGWREAARQYHEYVTDHAVVVARALLAAEGSALTPRDERKVSSNNALVEAIAKALFQKFRVEECDPPLATWEEHAIHRVQHEAYLEAAWTATWAISAERYRLEKVEDWDGRSIGESNPLSGACDIALQDALCQVDDRGERIWSYDDVKLQKSLAAQGYAISTITDPSNDRGEATPPTSLSGRE